MVIKNKMDDDYENDSFEDEEFTSSDDDGNSSSHLEEDEDDEEEATTTTAPKIMESHVAILNQRNDELESELESTEDSPPPPPVTIRDYAKQQRIQELQRTINENKAEIRKLEDGYPKRTRNNV